MAVEDAFGRPEPLPDETDAAQQAESTETARLVQAGKVTMLVAIPQLR
jgi:hypothetical protein